MDWAYRAMLTAAAVAAVLMAARLMGQRVAGLMAGLPVITAPVLVWVAAEQGTAFAVQSALGSVAACALAPWFGLVFLWLLAPAGPVTALLAAAAVLVAGGWGLLAWLPPAGHGLHALALTALACAVLARRLRRGSPPAAGGGLSGVRPLRGEPWLTAGAAGGVSALIGAAAPQLGPGWVGVLASAPLISAAALVHLHRAGSADDLRGFLRGYGQGIWGKALFGWVFAMAAPALGVPLALLLGLLAGAAAVAGLRRPLRGPRPA